MKILYKIFVVAVLGVSLSACDKGDIFTGSPVGTNVQFENLVGTVSTDATSVVASQSFPVTVTLPKTFAVDVSVEVISFLPNTNKRSRKYFIIKAGETSKTDLMSTPNAEQGYTLPFNLTMQLYLSAITTAPEVDPKGFAGKQYSLSSNTVVLDYGDSSIVAVNSNRCGVRLDWQGPYSSIPVVNDLNLRIKRGDGSVVTVAPNSQNTMPIYGTTVGTSRYETINFLSTAADDDYTFEVYAKKLVNTPSNLPYRFTVRFPNETTQVFSGILNDLVVTPNTGAVAKLKVTKTTLSDGAHYTVTPL